MRINDVTLDGVRPYPAKTDRIAATDDSGKGPAVPVTVVEKVDRVTISDEGRALANRDSRRYEAVSPERIAQIRGLVLSGAYGSLEAIEQLARRILATGEL